MLDTDAIVALVEADVTNGLGNIFTSDGPGFELLEVGGFAFGDDDLRPIDWQSPKRQTSCVAWSYQALHQGLMLGTTGADASGEEIPVIDPNPDPNPDLDNGPTPPAILPTGRPVRIVGMTLVVARDEEQEKSPVLLRFVDWADVYSQLGFPMSTRPPEPGGPGFQRIGDVSSS